MGRTWKFTEQIYEELKENVDKKLETHFDTGLMGNPFEKYAWEIDYGIAKMNDYVERVNEADGFNRAKLDRVFQQIADTDKKYGNQIKKCTEDLKHYNNVLYQLEVVMEQALTGSSNGNAVFDFDREAFQALVKDDKNAMDIAYVDRILSQDVGEITYDEYYAIAVLIGNQPTGDTALVEYILNRTDMWEFVDSSILEGNDPANITPGQPSTGVFVSSEKYQALSAMLSFYAFAVTMEKPENAEGTPYINFMNNVVMYEQLFRGIVANTGYNEWTYLTGSGQENAMAELHVNSMFQLKYQDGELVAVVVGEFGNNEIVSHRFREDDATISCLNDMQNTYINNFLGLNETGIEITANTIVNGLLDNLRGKVVEINPYVNLILNAIDAGAEQEEKRNAIYSYEKWGELADTFSLLELGFTYCECDYSGSIPNVIVSAYPGNETQDVLVLLNNFLASDEVKKDDYQEVIEQIPQGGFTVNYVLNHLEETDVFLDMLRFYVKKNGYANSVEEAIGKK